MGLNWEARGLYVRTYFEDAEDGEHEAAESEPDAKRARKTSDKAASSEALHSATLLDLTYSDSVQSKWLARILYGKEEFEIDSDTVLPAIKKPPETKPHAYDTMPDFDWNYIGQASATHAAQYGLDQAYNSHHGTFI